MKDFSKYQGIFPAFYACYDKAGKVDGQAVRKIGIRGSGRDVIPILGDTLGGQMEVDGRNRGDCLHPQTLRMRGQLTAVGGVVAWNGRRR